MIESMVEECGRCEDPDDCIACPFYVLSIRRPTLASSPVCALDMIGEYLEKVGDTRDPHEPKG